MIHDNLACPECRASYLAEARIEQPPQVGAVVPDAFTRPSGMLSHTGLALRRLIAWVRHAKS